MPGAGGGAPEPLSVVIDRLFPPSTSGISVSSTGSMPLGSEAPLWLLAQQQEKTFNTLALPRVLDEAIYESLQTAYQIVEDIDNADIAQGASFDDIEIEVVDNVDQQPSSEALVQRSVFSQLLIELDDTSEHCIVHEANENKTTAVDADEVRKIATESEFGRAVGRLLLREKYGLTAFADPELNADVHNLLERLMKKNSKIGIAEELICWAWLVSTDNLPEPGPPRSPTDPHTQHELASTPLQQSENPHAVMNGKRSIEYHDMEPADLQPSRKALRVQTAIDLLSPDPSMSSPGDVVDLCNDSLHFAYDVCAPEDSYDNELLLLEEHTSASQQLDPSLPSTNPSISAATSSAPHETGRDEAKAAERRDEPSWESLSAGELQLMAAQYGLNPADKRLMQLLKAMWSRMKEPSQPLAASQPLSQAVTTSSRGATIGLEALRACLMQSAALYERVLLFLPLEVDDVQRHLKECGHKISKTQLLPLLDQLYIFVDSSGGKKDRSQPS